MVYDSTTVGERAEDALVVRGAVAAEQRLHLGRIGAERRVELRRVELQLTGPVERDAHLRQRVEVARAEFLQERAAQLRAQPADQRIAADVVGFLASRGRLLIVDELDDVVVGIGELLDEPLDRASCRR